MSDDATSNGQTKPADGAPLVYTVQDFLDGYALQTRMTRKQFAGLAVFCSILLALMCATVPEWTGRLFISIAGLAGGALFWALARFVYYPWLARRQFHRQPLAHIARTVALVPEGLRFKSEDRGETLMRWSDFIAWRADSRSILLSTAPRVFMIIPMRLADLGFPVDDLKDAVARDFAMRKDTARK